MPGQFSVEINIVGFPYTRTAGLGIGFGWGAVVILGLLKSKQAPRGPTVNAKTHATLRRGGALRHVDFLVSAASDRPGR